MACVVALKNKNRLPASKASFKNLSFAAVVLHIQQYKVRAALAGRVGRGQFWHQVKEIYSNNKNNKKRKETTLQIVACFCY